MRTSLRSALCILGVFAGVAGLAGLSVARAEGQFQIDPTMVELAAGAQSGAVIVTNHGASPLRLEASVFAWSESPDGGMMLTPTSQLVVRPALLEIPAGGSRTLRVGSLASPGAAEQSFRLFVEELPDRSASRPAGVRVLTRIGVPVFVAPAQPRQAVTVTPAAVDGAQATVEVANTGTLHVKLASIELRAGELRADEPRTPRWSHKANGWYVLPGTSRKFAVEVGNDACKPGEALVAVATAETGASWTSAPVPCRR